MSPHPSSAQSLHKVEIISVSLLNKELNADIENQFGNQISAVHASYVHKNGDKSIQLMYILFNLQFETFRMEKLLFAINKETLFGSF